MANKYGDGPYGEGDYGTTDTTTDDDGGEDGYDTLGFGSGPFGGGTLAADDALTSGDVLPETPYFGGGRFGQGLYAYHTEQMIAIRDAWDSGGLSLHPDSNIYTFLEALAMPLGLLSDDLVEIHDAQHIDTARDGEIDLLGDLADVNRERNEPDARLKKRIIASLVAGTTGTTHSDVLQFLESILETSGGNIRIDRAPNRPGVAIVEVPRSALQMATLTADDISELATTVVPAGHRIEVIVSGTFEVESDDYDVPPERSLSSDDFQGGTLAGDIT